MKERDETEIGRRCHSRSATLAISARCMTTGPVDRRRLAPSLPLVILSESALLGRKRVPPERIELSIS